MTKTLKDQAKEQAQKKSNWKYAVAGLAVVLPAAGIAFQPDTALFVGNVLVAAGSALVEHAQSLLDAASNTPL